MKPRKRIVIITLAGSAAIATVSGAIVVYSGIYDVSATRQHTAAVYHLLETSLRRSVEMRTSDAPAPALDDADRIHRGFALFRANCVQCHGAPGIAPKPFA